MDVLSSRFLLRASDFDASIRFYRDRLGLPVYREWRGGVVFFLGGGYLEVSGSAAPEAATGTATGTGLWLQVRDLARTRDDLARRGVHASEPQRMPWGLLEMEARDPDGVRLVFVEVPADHGLRRGDPAS